MVGRDVPADGVLGEEVEADGGEGCAADDVDDVVLPGQESGQADQGEPDLDGPAEPARGVANIDIAQEQPQGDMEGGEEVVGLVERVEQVEERAVEAIDLRAGEADMQREGEEAGAGQERGAR